MTSTRTAPLALCVGGISDAFLIGGYARGLESLGWRIVEHDIIAGVRTHTKFGRAGDLFSRFIPVEPWITKANRAFVVDALDRQPDLVLVPGAVPARAGALAQIRASMPNVKIVLLWPDPLVNLAAHVIAALPIYDLVVTYSGATIGVLERLGAKRVEWLPFAVDDVFFPSESAFRSEFVCDVGFVGSHRPEREAAVLALLRAGFDVRVWGENDWFRHAADHRSMRRYWQGKGLYGKTMGEAFRSFRVSLNVIDRTNFPSANMRFFESPGCGGVTLNSACPEMEGIFRPGVHAAYFTDEKTLVARVRELLADPSLRKRIALAGLQLTRAEHTYRHRAEQLIDSLEGRRTSTGSTSICVDSTVK